MEKSGMYMINKKFSAHPRSMKKTEDHVDDEAQVVEF
jgi:hypothetical protein